MNPQRCKGYSYVEMLILLMTLPCLFMIMDKMFREIALDLPKSSQVVIQHQFLLRCLEFMEQDLAEAVALPQSHGTWQQDPNTLLIQLPDMLVAYVHGERGVERQVLEPNDVEGYMTWPIPQAHFQWTITPDVSEPTRIEVATAVQHTRSKKQKLKNTRLFYIGVDRIRGDLL
jgi:hypothetical protein